MTTFIIETIGPGGTHADLPAWRLAYNTTDLIANDWVVVGELLAGVHNLNGNTLVFNNPNTSRKNFRMLRPAAGAEHQWHVNPSGGARIQWAHSSGGTKHAILVSNEDGWTIEGVGIFDINGNVDDGADPAAIRLEAVVDVVINGCTIFWRGARSFFGNFECSPRGIDVDGSPTNSNGAYIVNNLVIGNNGVDQNFDRGARFGIRTVNCLNAKVFNNTVIGCDNTSDGASRAFRHTDGTGSGNPQSYNNLGVGTDASGTGDDFVMQATIDWRNCASEDLSAQAPTCIDGLDRVVPSLIFNAHQFNDYRLKPSAILIDAGEATISYLNIPFPQDWGPRRALIVDYTGSPRSGIPDVGCYEFDPIPIVPIQRVVSLIGVGQVDSTISQWEIRTRQNLVAPGTAFSNTIQVGRLVDEEYDIGGTNQQIEQAVVSSKTYRVLEAAPGNEFNQATGRGAKVFGTANQTLQIIEDYVELHGIGFFNNNTDTQAARHCVSIEANFATLDGVHVEQRGGTGENRTGIYARSLTTGHTIRNCSSRGNAGSSTGLARGIRVQSTSTIVENCMAVSTGGNVLYRTGIWSDQADCIVRNCISMLNDGDSIDLAKRPEFLAVDDDAGGAVIFGGLKNLDPADVFNGPGTHDYRLKPGSPCLGSGRDLSLRFQTAMAGGSRGPGQWDIGPWSGFAPQQEYPRHQFIRRGHLCHCWTVQRRDGVSLFFTDHDKIVPFRGNIYTPEGGFSASARRREGGLNASDMEIQAPIKTVTFDDLRVGKWEGAQIVEYVVNHRFPFSEPLEEQHYLLDDPRFDGEVWESDVLTQAERLNRHVGRYYGYNCDAVWGDARCGVDIAPWTIEECAVKSLNAQFLYDFTVDPSDIGNTLNGASVSDDFFNFAEVLWLTGDNEGGSSQVKTYYHNVAGDRRIVLQIRPPFPIKIGDTFDLLAGCNLLPGIDDSTGHCKNRYDNIKRFRGWPTTPGTDRMLATPTR